MDIKDLKNVIKQSAMYGNDEYGNAFDDTNACREKNLSFPTEIIARKGAIVDNLGFVYGNILLVHGGTGGNPMKFTLEKDEHIIRVSGSQERFDNVMLIQSLEFETDKKRVFSVGYPSQNGRFDYRVEPGYGICAMYGRSANYLGAIGFYARKVNMENNDVFGGMKGKFGL